MTQPSSPGSLRARLGMAIQRERQHRGLSQSQLAGLAQLSLKYVGEIERAEANATLDALQRLAVAMEWDPFESAIREPDAVPDGIRALLTTNLNHVLQLVQTALDWLSKLDAELVQRAMRALETDIPTRRRGRPRKPKVPPVDAE